jgi:hypothetical protein
MVLFFRLYSAGPGLFAALGKKSALMHLMAAKSMFFERDCPFFRPGHTANEVESAAYPPAVQDGDCVDTEDAAPTPGRASRRIFSWHDPDSSL